MKAKRIRPACLFVKLSSGLSHCLHMGNQQGTATRPKGPKRETQRGYLIGTTAHGHGYDQHMAQWWVCSWPCNGWNATNSRQSLECHWPTGHTKPKDITIWDKAEQNKSDGTASPNLSSNPIFILKRGDLIAITNEHVRLDFDMRLLLCKISLTEKDKGRWQVVKWGQLLDP